MESMQIVRPNSGLSLIGDPDSILAENKKVADVLMKLVRDRKLAQRFGEKEHIMVDAWLTLGSWFGVSATCPNELTQFVSDTNTGREGYIATARLVSLATGELLGIEATAECDNFEENWGVRAKYTWENGQRRKTGEVIVPRFQLRSMAITRAIGKVLGIKYRHIVVLAGFETTPAEEMTGTESNGHRESPQQSQSTPKDEPKRISENQRKRIFAIGHQFNVPMPEIVKIFKSHGFSQALEITIDKYDLVVAAVQSYKVA